MSTRSGMMGWHPARTTDHGVAWKGVGTNAIASTALASDSFSPEVTVTADGTIYIFWLNGEAGNQIQFVASTDGGSPSPPHW